MPIERGVSVLIISAFLVALLILTYATRAWLFGTLFVAVALIGAAFYLFQFGPLGSFTIKALSTEASFIREKAEAVKADAAAVEELRKTIEKQASVVNEAVTTAQRGEREIQQVKARLLGLEGDLTRLEKGLVEMEYLLYAGRNIFPNPYHDRIMKILNDLLVIAVPNPEERGRLVKELELFTKPKTSG